MFSLGSLYGIRFSVGGAATGTNSDRGGVTVHWMDNG